MKNAKLAALSVEGRSRKRFFGFTHTKENNVDLISASSVKKLMVSAMALAVMAGPATAHAAEAPKAPFNEEQKAALEDFVRDFIMNNPEVLIESVNKMREAEVKKQDEAAKSALETKKDFFYNNPQLPSVGNPKADITVVEFFDYNCGYCKHALDTVKKNVENDKNVRFVFIDLPILSPQSETAAKWALAANKQGKYWEYYQALLESTAPKSDENLADIAKSVGLDVERLKKDAASDEVSAIIAANHEAARALNVSGTPAFVIGDEIVRGYMEYEGMKSVIADQRKKAKK